MKKKHITPRELAERWNIPYISDTHKTDAWQRAFMALGVATGYLDQREYEIENNFEYDIVVKTRPDCVFDPRYHFSWELLENNILYATQGGLMETEFHMFNTNDMVFYGNSYTMDLVMQMYFYRQQMLDQRDIVKDKLFTGSIGPGVLMQEYFRDYGITSQSILPYRHTFIETLVKLGCPDDLNLLDHNDFHKMEKYFRDWYLK